MLYETSARKPGNAPSKPVTRSAQQAAGPQTTRIAPKKPQSMPTGAAIKHKPSATPSKPQAVKGWPSRQGAVSKPAATAVAGHHRQRVTGTGHTATVNPRKTTKGWSSTPVRTYKSPATHTTSYPHQRTQRHGYPGTAAAHKPGQHKTQYYQAGAYKPVPHGSTTHPYYGRHYKGYAPRQATYGTVRGWSQPSKTFGKPAGTPAPVRRRYRDPQGRYYYYYPGTNRRFYYNGTLPNTNYVNAPGTILPAQPRSPRAFGYDQPAPASCPSTQSNGYGYSNQPVTGTPATKVCHTCGTTRGCITLSRFAFNSAALKPRHLGQLREIAGKILAKNIRTIVATGHTDSSGSEDYNQSLGEKRAYSVISELKKQLSMLQPNGHKNLFWQTDSKGETQPISKTNPANNRRVEICIRRRQI